MIQIVDFKLSYGTRTLILLIFEKDFHVCFTDKTYVNTQAFLPFAFVIFSKENSRRGNGSLLSASRPDNCTFYTLNAV